MDCVRVVVQSGSVPTDASEGLGGVPLLRPGPRRGPSAARCAPVQHYMVLGPRVQPWARYRTFEKMDPPSDDGRAWEAWSIRTNPRAVMMDTKQRTNVPRD